METYTADAVALLTYLIDALPRKTDRIFAAAETGGTVIQAPSTALGETLYSVSRDKDVRGVTLSGTPEKARRTLLGSGPISLVPVETTEITEYARVVDRFSIYDAVIVASHRARNTKAVLTTDTVIEDAGIETIWT